MLSNVINAIVPVFIHVFEIMGIIVLSISATIAFYHYIRGLKPLYNVRFKYQFANSMATALEFKLAAEILKTVIVRTVEDIAILASIIILRAIMSFIIHLEMKTEMEHGNND